MEQHSVYYKTDVEGLVKDPVSGAVLNVDNNKLDAYRKQKQVFQTAKDTSDRMNNVEKRLDEITNVLQELLKRV